MTLFTGGAAARTGGDFTGGEATGGGDLTGGDLTGGDWTGGDWTGGDWTGGDFTAGGAARRGGEGGRSRLDADEVDDWRACRASMSRLRKDEL